MQMSAAMRSASSAICRAPSVVWPRSARAAASAYGPPDPIATAPPPATTSGSMTSPAPETTRTCSRSATMSSASSRRSRRSVRHCFASSTAARGSERACSFSFFSNSSKSWKASAVAPAKPASTAPSASRRTLRAVAFITVLSSVTCPSLAIATLPSRRTHRTVVPWSLSMEGWVARGVAEQLLDPAKVGAVAEEVRREGVAKHVRVHVARKPGGDHPAGDPAGDRTCREAAAAVIQEERVAAAWSGEARPRVVAVAPQRLGRGPPEGDDPLLPPLAEDAHEPLLEIDVARREPRQLGDPKTARVEQLEEGAVAQREQAGRRGGRLDERGHLLLGQRLRQPLRPARARHRTRRVRGSEPLPHEESIEGAERRELAAEARRARAPRRARDEGADERRGGRHERRPLRREKRGVLREIGEVGAERVRRGALLRLEMDGEPPDLGRERRRVERHAEGVSPPAPGGNFSAG